MIDGKLFFLVGLGMRNMHTQSSRQFIYKKKLENFSSNLVDLLKIGYISTLITPINLPQARLDKSFLLAVMADNPVVMNDT